MINDIFLNFFKFKGFIGIPNAIGPLFPIAEMQSRWFVQLIAGKIDLPSNQMMKFDVEKYQKFRFKSVDLTCFYFISILFLFYLIFILFLFFHLNFTAILFYFLYFISIFLPQKFCQFKTSWCSS